jgi:hypothetical protein
MLGLVTNIGFLFYVVDGKANLEQHFLFSILGFSFRGREQIWLRVTRSP